MFVYCRIAEHIPTPRLGTHINWPHVSPHISTIFRHYIDLGKQDDKHLTSLDTSFATWLNNRNRSGPCISCLSSAWHGSSTHLMAPSSAYSSQTRILRRSGCPRIPTFRYSDPLCKLDLQHRRRSPWSFWSPPRCGRSHQRSGCGSRDQSEIWTQALLPDCDCTCHTGSHSPDISEQLA